MPHKSKPKKEKIQAIKEKKEQEDDDDEVEVDEDEEEDEAEVTSSDMEEFEALGPYAITSNQIKAITSFCQKCVFPLKKNLLEKNHKFFHKNRKIVRTSFLGSLLLKLIF